jgi:hypothetical protein
MQSIVLRMLALIAVVLMQIGMTPTAAAAMHQTGASAATNHCGGQAQPQYPPNSAQADDCTGCAAVAPVAPLAVAPQDVPAVAHHGSLADLRLGLILEIATPPPKRS